MTDDFSLSCPAPAPSEETIQLAHGGGGTLMHRLLNEVFFPAFGSKDHDGAVFPVAAGSLAFSTGSPVSDVTILPEMDFRSELVVSWVGRWRALSSRWALRKGARFGEPISSSPSKRRMMLTGRSPFSAIVFPIPRECASI